MKRVYLIPLYGFFVGMSEYLETADAHARACEKHKQACDEYKRNPTAENHAATWRAMDGTWAAMDKTWPAAGSATISLWITVAELAVIIVLVAIAASVF